jgi:multidrug efflux pump subunit AcrA (membrane-fusion protein)
MMTVALRNAQLYSAVPSLSVWGRFRFLRNIPRRIAVSGAVAVAAAAAVLSLMKIDFTVNGTFEAMPRQKYVLYAAVDQAVVSRVVADPARPTGRGDTLLLFNTDEITQGILRERNTAAMLQQAMSTLNQQGDYGQLNTKALELKQARLTLASLERKLVESTVTAPVAGRFSSNDLQNFTGRKFNRGDQLVEIIPDGDGTLRLLVPEKHVNRVVAGQECRFRVPAYPGVTMRGVVRQVTYDTEGENGSVTFPVIVDVAGAGRPLLPGMSGKGKITVGSRSIMAALLDRPISFLAEKLWL